MRTRRSLLSKFILNITLAVVFLIFYIHQKGWEDASIGMLILIPVVFIIAFFLDLALYRYSQRKKK